MLPDPARQTLSVLLQRVADLAGVPAKLPYLASPGIDAIWFTPWYPSPMDDGGYDVADFRDIEPAFGTLSEAEQLITEAHALGNPDHPRCRAQPLLGSRRSRARRLPLPWSGTAPPFGFSPDGT